MIGMTSRIGEMNRLSPDHVVVQRPEPGHEFLQGGEVGNLFELEALLELVPQIDRRYTIPIISFEEVLEQEKRKQVVLGIHFLGVLAWADLPWNPRIPGSRVSWGIRKTD